MIGRIDRISRAIVVLSAIAWVAAPARADAPANAGEYRFVKPEALAGEELVGQKVTFVDEVAILWENQDAPGYVKFDTAWVRCLLPESDTVSAEVVRSVLDRRSEDLEPTPPRLVVVWGTYQRVNVHGEAPTGVLPPEEAAFVCDAVTPPAEREVEAWKSR